MKKRGMGIKAKILIAIILLFFLPWLWPFYVILSIICIVYIVAKTHQKTHHTPINPYRYVSSDVRKKVYHRDAGRCVICGATKGLQYDHIIPVSRGGGNTAENIQLLCQNCNKLKSNKIM
jgi:HNH endonuclease